MSPNPEALKRILILSLFAQPSRLEQFMAASDFANSIWVRYYLLDPALCTEVKNLLQATRSIWEAFLQILPQISQPCPHPPCLDELFLRGVMDLYRLGDGNSSTAP